MSEAESSSGLLESRNEKLRRIRESGINPYPYRFTRTHTLGEALAQFDALAASETRISLCGRLMILRPMGKTTFGDLAASDGKIQVYFRKNDLGDEAYEFLKLLDIGDFIGVEGTLFVTKMGERTIRVVSLTLLSKSLRPLPVVKEREEDGVIVRHHEVSDKEFRYRRRYVDLVVNPPVRQVFLMRSRILQHVRRFLDDRGYLEVETPTLQTLYGGASARPFLTHHNALDMKLYLRIAVELYLKRLVVGGIDRVYEIAKNFRNEGIDRDHNPEFTLLEFYQAYSDYNDMMELAEEMISGLVLAIHGKFQIPYLSHTLDFTRPWKRIRFTDSLGEALGLDVMQSDDRALCEAGERKGMNLDPSMGRPKILDELYSDLVEPHLIQPTFVLDHPKELSPLAKAHRIDPGLTERFELIIAGMELVNAFSELNDPLDQRARFEAQARLREMGDDEAQLLDEDFLRALEYGMPPTGGVGIGIDRLTMIVANQASIRDVILFPHMRPESQDSSTEELADE